MCYEFIFKRHLKSEETDSYFCCSCHKQDKVTLKLTVSVVHPLQPPFLQVRNGHAAEHPESLPHVCSAVSFAESQAERKFYEIRDGLRKSTDAVKPLPAYRKLLMSITEDVTLSKCQANS